MSRLLSMILILVLLAGCAPALADFDGLLDETLSLAQGMNANLSAGADDAPGLLDDYYAFDDFIRFQSHDERIMLDVLPKGDWEEVRMLTLRVYGADLIDAALQDIQYIAYTYGSGDSVEAALLWSDKWADALRQSLKEGTAQNTAVLQCPALVAMGTLVTDEGAPHIKFTVMPEVNP
ncbi:MAG: hypothetical protein E7317_08035 [Clostridiales bacterium]|nr:hypothetical protein [Clostridiales bacterium]